MGAVGVITLAVAEVGARPGNWTAGWVMLLLAFGVGAVVGLFFHREDFWGGYASYRRRLVRLGHIALAALGILNIVFSLARWPGADSFAGQAAGLCLIAGGLLMPATCFLSAWKKPLRHLFCVPVTLLIAAVVLVLW